MGLQRAELVVPAATEYLELVGDFVSFMARRAGFADEEVARIRLAADEAAANVVLHVTARGVEEAFRVVCEEAADALTIRVQDAGEPFDLGAVPIPNLDAPLEKRNVGGLGIYLIRRVMDSVEIRPTAGGKELVLVKQRPGAAGETHGG
ncbi:MAG: ATP-binding protein [Armatimonadetes bacterium]|nr:ATP-binding protein [Armatimonadota bacterium]